MLLTGTGSILSGAPGAVLLYPLLGLAVWARKLSKASSNEAAARTRDDGLLSRRVLRWVLSGFWFFAALLQLQPNWWQPGQISQAIGAMVGQGGLNSVLVDPVLRQISNATANIEIPLNIALVVVNEKQLRPFLIASIVVSVLVWYFSEAFGMILTGMATDFNSGLLLVVMALTVWPHVDIKQAESAHAHEIREASQKRQGEGSAQHA